VANTAPRGGRRRIVLSVRGGSNATGGTAVATRNDEVISVMNEKRFSGKIALVTGASSGIGRAAVIDLVREGATVIAAARRSEQGSAVIEAARAATAGAQVRFVQTDISSSDSVDALFDVIAADYGRLDVAFNNAGVEADAAELPDTPIEVFDSVFGINVRGTWMCMRHEMRLMREQGHGAIVNTSSIAGLIAYPHSSVYTGSKHAIIGMTKSAALDLADRGVRVNCLCPGATRGEMASRWVDRVPGGEEAMVQTIPMKRMGTPEELAAVAMFLLSDAASYMTGAIVVADGGSVLG